MTNYKTITLTYWDINWNKTGEIKITEKNIRQH